MRKMKTTAVAVMAKAMIATVEGLNKRSLDLCRESYFAVEEKYIHVSVVTFSNISNNTSISLCLIITHSFLDLC